LLYKTDTLEDINSYLNINRNAWNHKTSIHTHSEFYDMPSFKNGENSLKEIELDLLGDVTDRFILHLQCHFGQDSMSLSRLGALVTGVDFSDEAINYAARLADELHLDTQFVLSDVYDLKNHLAGQFDVVFTSYGVIGWLPDLDKWAEIIHHFLKPGGSLIMVEFHPVIWMFDNDFEKVAYSYFKDGQIVEKEQGSYADRNNTSEITTITWNHSLGEVLSSLLKQGLQVKDFREYDYSPYNCLNDMYESSPGKYRIKQFGHKIPMVYALKVGKPK
jgi:2-polyprenyl-3-methyl-5-hydroxy-6-metoxy-1,4-benzoquinol methylase